MNPRNKQYTRQDKENMIWKHTHPDYRSLSGDNKRMIMPPASISKDYGSLVSLNNIDDKGLEMLFDSALDREVKMVLKNIFIQSFDGNYEHLDEGFVNQWSSSFRDMKMAAKGVDMTDKQREQTLSEIERLQKKFDESTPNVNNYNDYSYNPQM